VTSWESGHFKKGGDRKTGLVVPLSVALKAFFFLNPGKAIVGASLASVTVSSDDSSCAQGRLQKDNPTKLYLHVHEGTQSGLVNRLCVCLCVCVCVCVS